jgi:hypothetical protein
MAHRRLNRLALPALILVAGMIALTAAPALALGEVPDTSVFIVRGKVGALVETPDHSTIYLAGAFSRASDQAGHEVYFPVSVTRFNESTGVGDPTWLPSVLLSDGTPGTINAMALSPDGSTLYIGGTFATVDGQPRKNIAAISTSDASVLPFTATVGDAVDTILLGTDTSGDVTKVYIGGAFKRIDRKPVAYLAALNPDGSVDTTFQASTDAAVHSLAFASDGQSIFVGGTFTSVVSAGVTYPRQSVARIGLDGSINDWQIPAGVILAPQTAWSFSVTPTALFVGFGNKANYAGAFRLDDGVVGDKIWILHTPGNVETTSLAPDGTHLFLGGHFGTAHKTHQICPNVAVHGIGEVNLSNGAWVCWAPHIFPDQLNFTGAAAVLANPTYLWVGGNFNQICTPDGITQCVPVQAIARFTM